MPTTLTQEKTQRIKTYIRKLQEIQRFLENNYNRSTSQVIHRVDSSLNNLRINTYWTKSDTP